MPNFHLTIIESLLIVKILKLDEKILEEICQKIAQLFKDKDCTVVLYTSNDLETNLGALSSGKIMEKYLDGMNIKFIIICSQIGCNSIKTSIKAHSSLSEKGGTWTLDEMTDELHEQLKEVLDAPLTTT